LLKTNEEKESELAMDIHRNKSKLESHQSQVSFYTELVEQKEGYPEGVRTVLDSPRISLESWVRSVNYSK
jgi:hypothetical protein